MIGSASKTDYRERCRNGHLICQDHHGCSSWTCDDPEKGRSEGNFGGGRVTTDRSGRTLCVECRYDRDVDEGRR